MVDMTDVIEQRLSNYEKSICEKCSHRRVCRAIDNQPCFECNQFAEEVVRCKDCKHFVQSEPYDPCECMKWTVKWGVAYANPDDFCSYGERREGE